MSRLLFFSLSILMLCSLPIINAMKQEEQVKQNQFNLDVVPTLKETAAHKTVDSLVSEEILTTFKKNPHHEIFNYHHDIEKALKKAFFTQSTVCAQLIELWAKKNEEELNLSQWARQQLESEKPEQTEYKKQSYLFGVNSRAVSTCAPGGNSYGYYLNTYPNGVSKFGLELNFKNEEKKEFIQEINHSIHNIYCCAPKELRNGFFYFCINFTTMFCILKTNFQDFPSVELITTKKCSKGFIKTTFSVETSDSPLFHYQDEKNIHIFDCANNFTFNCGTKKLWDTDGQLKTLWTIIEDNDFFEKHKETGPQAFVKFLSTECTLKQALVLYLLLEKKEDIRDQNQAIKEVFNSLPEYIKVLIPIDL